MAKASEKLWTAGGIMDLIRGKHSGQAWATLPQVPDGTGGHKSRTADALAMSLWPSQGLHLHGFEIKVIRSDWLREIQDPSKADTFASRCDYWWIVAPEGVVQLAEMPGSWGLMQPTRNGQGLTVKKGAERRASPEGIDRPFLAAIFRALHRDLPGKKELSAEYERGYKECRERLTGGREAEKHAKKLEEDYRLKKLRESVEAFEAVSGIKIDEYNGDRVGDLLMAIDAARMPALLGYISRLADSCETSAKDLHRAHELISGALAPASETAA